MDEDVATVGFLCYKPNVHEFLYNVSCQVSQTMLFTDAAPVVMGDNLCFLFYNHIDVSRFDVCKAINSILNYNICNFFDRYGVGFEEHFKRDLTLLRVRLIDESFFSFGVNKVIISDQEGYLRTDLGRTISYEYVIHHGDVPIYGYMQNSYVELI